MLSKEDMKDLEGLKSLAMKDIKCVVEKGQILPTDYPNLEKATNIVHYIHEIIKDDATVDAMENYGSDYEVSSRAMPYGNSYGPNVHLPMDNYSSGPYSGNGSYERGRSARTGRYMSRDNDMRAQLMDEMSRTADPNERMALQRVIDRM